jgi:HSP20 family protein
MVNLVKWDPFKELDDLSRQLFGETLSPGTGAMILPTTDVYLEDEDRLVVEAHLPGYADKDVEVNVHDGWLEVRAEKHDKEEDKRKRKYVMRESSSSFYRRVRLPKQTNLSAINAHMDEGLLKVTVPFKELPKPTKIEIQGKDKK